MLIHQANVYARSPHIVDRISVLMVPSRHRSLTGNGTCRMSDMDFEEHPFDVLGEKRQEKACMRRDRID